MVAREEALEEWEGVNTAILLATIADMPLPDGKGGGRRSRVFCQQWVP